MKIIIERCVNFNFRLNQRHERERWITAWNIILSANPVENLVLNKRMSLFQFSNSISCKPICFHCYPVFVAATFFSNCKFLNCKYQNPDNFPCQKNIPYKNWSTNSMRLKKNARMRWKKKWKNEMKGEIEKRQTQYKPSSIANNSHL